MEKEKVEVLVRNLMEKLCIREIDLEDIMRCYTADADSVPVLKTPEITKDDLNILKGDLNIL